MLSPEFLRIAVQQEPNLEQRLASFNEEFNAFIAPRLSERWQKCRQNLSSLALPTHRLIQRSLIMANAGLMCGGLTAFPLAQYFPETYVFFGLFLGSTAAALVARIYDRLDQVTPDVLS